MFGWFNGNFYLLFVKYIYRRIIHNILNFGNSKFYLKYFNYISFPVERLFFFLIENNLSKRYVTIFSYVFLFHLFQESCYKDYKYIAIISIQRVILIVPFKQNFQSFNISFKQTHIEEVVDQDTIERNRMMAKLHLMEYDETLKHRVKNDLESEEFPEDFMVDVPDKLPKQSVTKKLSQAEARLKRFKNANAKRGNNVTKSQTIALKKRTDPIFPAKFSPRYVEIKDKRDERIVKRSVKMIHTLDNFTKAFYSMFYIQTRVVYYFI